MEVKVKSEMDVDRGLCDYCGACVGMCICLKNSMPFAHCSFFQLKFRFEYRFIIIHSDIIFNYI